MSSLVMSRRAGHWTSDSNCSKDPLSSSVKVEGQFQTRGSANIRTVTAGAIDESTDPGDTETASIAMRVKHSITKATVDGPGME